MSDRQPDFDDALPWLQEVEDEDAPSGISAGKMLAILFFVLLGAALVAGSFFWLGRRDSGDTGAPELIQAPPEPYKVEPENPGGLDVAGESETAFQTSAGEDHDARLNVEAIPERERPAVDADPAEQEAEAEPEPEPEPEPTAPSGAPGTVIQLGAFRNSAQAERAWSALSARFPAVAALEKRIVPYPGGMRLRAAAASAAEAREACQAVQAGGEACFIAR